MASPAQSKLQIADSPRGDDRDFLFPLNPTVDRDHAAQYADVPIALDDAGPTSLARASEWIRNRPQMIHLEFPLYDSGMGMTINGVVEVDDVEADIRKLEVLMEKDARTGEPPDLLFVHGPRTDLVRLDSINFKDKNRYSTDLRTRWQDVRIALRVITPRHAGRGM